VHYLSRKIMLKKHWFLRGDGQYEIIDSQTGAPVLTMCQNILRSIRHWTDYCLCRSHRKICIKLFGFEAVVEALSSLQFKEPIYLTTQLNYSLLHMSFCG
jgi:hypothetical protein